MIRWSWYVVPTGRVIATVSIKVPTGRLFGLVIGLAAGLCQPAGNGLPAGTDVGLYLLPAGNGLPAGTDVGMFLLPAGTDVGLFLLLVGT
ncbi:hypothetical protein Tco_0383145 [Tanacetum coccineum]